MYCWTWLLRNGGREEREQAGAVARVQRALELSDERLGRVGLAGCVCAASGAAQRTDARQDERTV